MMRWIIIGILASLTTAFPALANTPSVRASVVRDYARLTFEWPRATYLSAKTNGHDLIIQFDRKVSPNMGQLLTQMSPYVTRAQRKADGKTLVLTMDKPYRVRSFVSDRTNGVDLIGVDPKARHKPAKPKPKPAPTVPEEEEEQIVARLAELAPAAGEEKPAEKTEEKPAEPVILQAPTAETAPPFKINVSATDDSTVLRLPFKERVAIAAFIRNRSLWLVFNKAMPLDLSDFESLPRTVIGKAQWIKSERASVLRMPVDDGVYINIAKEDGSLEWAVLLTSKKHMPTERMRVIVNVEPPSPPHVFVPALDAAEPVVVIDPQIGDRMIVTPFYNVDHGLAHARDFVEFRLLKSAQGLAVVKKDDGTVVVPLRNGLRVSTQTGATLSPGLPEVKEEQAGSASVALATLFPHALWKLEASTNARLYLNALLHRIALSKTPQEANELRLRMAQYYLSESMAAEALGALEGINRTNPSYFRSSKLAALRGAANFLMHRFVDASRDFASSELNNNKEIDYWRSMLADLLGNPDQDFDYMAMNDDYFSKYPPVLRQRLAIVAADHNIVKKEYNMALKIFDSLQQDKQLEGIKAYINFLLAKISSETGQETDAAEMWDKLAEDYKQPFVRANAEFSRTIWAVNHGHITKDQAIDRFEKLRLAWHGDNLELQILTLLGDTYSEQKDYINAMRIWHGAIQSFPNTSTAINMNRRMQEAFIAMFNEGQSDELPPLEALALYYEYRAYMPSGNTGDELMDRLADRLISVDLLDQAASLLDHQMKFQMEKEKRSRVGAKLASVHLLNRQPKKALTSLQDSMYGENSLMLKLQRNRLTAEALMALGEPDRALAALGQDNSPEAERVRLDIYWRERDWAKIIDSVEGVLKARTDAAAPITLAESELLLKLSLAYVFTGDAQQLRYLRDYFGPLMKENQNRLVFDYVTSPDVLLTTRNFDAIIENMTNTRTFIDQYNARVKTTEIAQTATTN